MSKPYPNNPYLRGNFAPIRMECDAPDLIIEGEMPQDLNGSLYRIGPDPQFAPRDSNHHWFAGDGMIHGFHIEDGKVGYLNRWVRTPKFELERAAGESLYGAFGNPMTSDPSVHDKDSTIANTNIVWHADKLLALEEGHAPYGIDPVTLESRGYHTFDDKLEGPMTAHPKMDAKTGEMFFFGYNAKGPFTDDLSYHVVSADGTLTSSEWFKAPYSAMVHDFIVSGDYAIFPIFPLTGSIERAIAGAPPFAWEPEKGGWVGVMPRDGSADSIRWFRASSSYVFHPMNAFNEGGKITAHVMQYEQAPLFPSPDGTPADPDKAQARLCKWTIDMDGNTDEIKEEYIDDSLAEFPRLDERFAGYNYRHGYFAAVNERHKGDTGLFNQLAHFDLATGKKSIYEVGPADAVSEPVFVPRSEDAPEGQGYLLATVYRGEEHRSDLVVLDAENVADGPIATAKLSHRIPFGFHGNWRQAR